SSASSCRRLSSSRRRSRISSTAPGGRPTSSAHSSQAVWSAPFTTRFSKARNISGSFRVSGPGTGSALPDQFPQVGQGAAAQQAVGDEPDKKGADQGHPGTLRGAEQQRRQDQDEDQPGGHQQAQGPAGEGAQGAAAGQRRAQQEHGGHQGGEGGHLG